MAQPRRRDTAVPDATATHCPYCALQCGMYLAGRAPALEVLAHPKFPVNNGGLCLKGWTSAQALTHPERLRTPLVRAAGGELAPAGWDEALDLVARRFREVQAAHGASAVGVFGGGSLTNEKVYAIGKFARVALGSSSIDYNGRFCMSSAAAASIKAFGLDRGLPFPLEDIPHAGTILLVGANVAETMPPLMQYFEAQQARGGRLIVVDPRRSATAAWATLHLALRPGSDAALANGLLHLLIRHGTLDEAYIRDRTEGFEEVRRVVASYWPERVESLTGVPQAALEKAASLIGSPRTMVLTARGAEQQAQGVSNALAFINIALALGAVGRRSSGFGTLTGQGNGQGGREHGQKADQLPGYRRLDDPAARRHIAQVWGVAEADLPPPGRSAYELLESLGREVKALFVVGSNVAVSAPHANRVGERLQALDFLVVSDFFLSETAARADVVLPAAQWAEEDGTMTNLEGRVLLRRRACAPPPGTRTDLEILAGLAARLGKGRFFPSDSRTVFEELRLATKGAPADYSGISYERLEAEDGVFWPCPSSDHPGTPRLFSDRFPTPSGRARFHAVVHQPPAETRDAEYPLYLTTGRVLAQYQSGTQTRRIARLQEAMPEPQAEIHPLTARRYGVRDGGRVTLATRRGEASFVVKETAGIREDTVFVPFHWGGAQSANRLTNPALDPISRMPEFKVCAVRLRAASSSADPQETQ